MSDEIPPTTTVESRPIVRHRLACTCGARGPWHERLDLAEGERDEHRAEHRGGRR